MWGIIATRGTLLDFAQCDVEASLYGLREMQPSDIGDLSGDDLLLLWKNKPRAPAELPAAIVTSSSEQKRDCLAWAITYLQPLRPVTAFCRVLSKDEACKAASLRSNTTLDGFAEACLGLVIGETATYLAEGLDSAAITPEACRAAYSYAMTQGVAVDAGTLEDDLITNAWWTTREVGNQPHLPIQLRELRLVWDVLLTVMKGGFALSGADVPRPPDQIVSACIELNKGEIAQSANTMQWDDRLVSLLGQMQGPREQRVTAFEEAASELTSRHRPDIVEPAFACGYFASRIDPGSLSHIPVVAPYLKAMPTAIMWYGLCAGLYPHSGVMDFSEGVGRRLLRDMLRGGSFLDRPTCDIAASELEVIAKGKTPLLDFPRGHQGSVEVEIMPGVTTYLSLGEGDAGRPDQSGSAMPDADAVLRRVASALNELIQAKDLLTGRTKRQPEKSQDKRKGSRNRGVKKKTKR